MTSKFSITAELAAAVTGQVCYRRVGIPELWSPVFQAPKPMTHLYFNLENARYPTLYQEVSIKIRKGSVARDPVVTFKGTDKIYFIEEAEGKAEKDCKVSPPNGKQQKDCAKVKPPNGSKSSKSVTDCNVKPPKFATTGSEKPCVVKPEKNCANTPKMEGKGGVTLWDVVPATDGVSAMVTVIIKSKEFTVGKTYKMCYLEKGTKPSHVYSSVVEASYTLIDGIEASVKFTVLNSMFTEHVIMPSTPVFGGQGPVTLSITPGLLGTGSPLGNGQGAKRPYLIPCKDAECSNKNDIAALCSKDNPGTVTTGEVTGFGTGTLTTTFTAPVTPAASYGICVPYCFKTSTCSVISWALVNSANPIKFLPTNPSYTLNPSSPEASTVTEMTFIGTDLRLGDKIRIITQGQVCPGPSSSDLQYTVVEVTAASTTTTLNKIRLSAPLAAPVNGQVCYSRVDTPEVWSLVSQTPEPKTALYFTLENADVPTLYQEVRVKIRKGFVATDSLFIFKETDKVYFIEESEGTAEKSCVVSPPTTGVTLWGVVPATDKNTAIANVIIKDGEFTVGNTYKMCYIKKGVGAGVSDQVFKASLTDKVDKPVPFTVLSSMFTAYVITPSTPVSAGQGPVTLSITEADQTAAGRAFGKEIKVVTQRPYLIPCPTEDCSNKNEIVALCSSKYNKDIVTTDDVTGFGTGTLTTTFTAPVTPAASYGICVPYCFKTGKCDSAISWALVNSDTPIKFKAANLEVTKTIPATPTSDPIIVHPQHNKTTSTKGESATAISSTIPAVLITSVVFLYLYK